MQRGQWNLAERYIGVPLVEEDSYYSNNLMFCDGWKSINSLKPWIRHAAHAARRTCGKLDVRCSP